jgi:hypothetical protein
MVMGSGTAFTVILPDGKSALVLPVLANVQLVGVLIAANQSALVPLARAILLG